MVIPAFIKCTQKLKKGLTPPPFCVQTICPAPSIFSPRIIKCVSTDTIQLFGRKPWRDWPRPMCAGICAKQRSWRSRLFPCPGLRLGFSSWKTRRAQAGVDISTGVPQSCLCGWKISTQWRPGCSIGLKKGEKNCCNQSRKAFYLSINIFKYYAKIILLWVK